MSLAHFVDSSYAGGLPVVETETENSGTGLHRLVVLARQSTKNAHFTVIQRRSCGGKRLDECFEQPDHGRPWYNVSRFNPVSARGKSQRKRL